MHLVAQEILRGSLTMAKILGITFVVMVLAGLYWPFKVSNWDWGLILVGCGALAGFLRSRKGSSLIAAVLGVVLPALVFLVIIASLPAPVQALSFGQLVIGLVYVSAASAAVATIGFYLGRLFLTRRRERPS